MEKKIRGNSDSIRSHMRPSIGSPAPWPLDQTATQKSVTLDAFEEFRQVLLRVAYFRGQISNLIRLLKTA